MERDFKKYVETIRAGYQVNRTRNDVASALGAGMVFTATFQEDIRKVLVLDAFAAVTFVSVTIDSLIEGIEKLRKESRNE